ncbi:MAG: hypothetical protein SNJ71_00165 [Bacteroidales bacterium]
MALDTTRLKNDIISIADELKKYDGSAGKTQDDAIKKQAELMAEAIERYVTGATVVCTPAQITSATMLAGGYPVTATNNLNGTIE